MDLADLLECSVCLEQLSHHNKVLPCQHTFCTQCLKDVYNKNKQLECPECRLKISDSIDSLPPNILANRILESMGQRKTSQVQPSVAPPPVPSHSIPKPNAPITPIIPFPKKIPAAVPTTEITIMPSHTPMVQTNSQEGHKFSLPINKIVSPMSTPVKSQTEIMSSSSSSSSILSPVDGLIPGNPKTNPFLSMIDSCDTGAWGKDGCRE